MTLRKIVAAVVLIPAVLAVGACSADSKERTEDAKEADTSSSQIVLGDTTIAVSPSVQCSIHNEFTISISGVGVEDKNVEFTFDVFDTETQSLSVTTADGTQWYTETDLDFTVEGETKVTGSTELTAINGSGTKPATFEFECK